jgi:hypothetical protein
MSEHSNYCDHPVGRCLYSSRLVELEMALIDARREIQRLTELLDRLGDAKAGAPSTSGMNLN